MLPHQERVIAEQLELSTKVLALGKFIGSVMFRGLDKEEQSRLRKQYFHMAQYLSVLAERVENFPKVDVIKHESLSEHAAPVGSAFNGRH